MKISGINLATGEAYTSEIPDVSPSILSDLASLEFSKKELQAKIDNLPFSADVKALLYQMGAGIIRVGTTIVKVGQKILEFVIKIVSAYPNTSFALVIGVLAGTLIGSIPIIGFVLGPVVTPLLAALGMLSGARADIQSQVVERKIREALDTFDPLKGEKPVA